MDLYLENALKCSKETTKNYSSSFSMGVRLLHGSVRDAIYAIYGFVRFADEIVDTFYGHNQEQLLQKFKEETYQAIQDRISINPIIHSFQWAVNTFGIEKHLVESFLSSMEMDLTKKEYDAKEYQTYIYGSAEVVGLMCLQVFCQQNPKQYNELVNPARKLGEAFQKVNFLRDMESDFETRGRTYFPNVDFNQFTPNDKIAIENEISNDFREALKGIVILPMNSRLGVYLAYSYYLELLSRIKQTQASVLINQRIRVTDIFKIWILIKCYFVFYLKRGNIGSAKRPSTNIIIESNIQQVVA